MKKTYFLLVILVILSLVVAACGNGQTPPADPDPSADGQPLEGEEPAAIDMDPVVWTAVTHIDTSTQHFVQQQAMCDAIAERTNGLLTIELYTVGEFAFSGTDLLSVTSDRTIDMNFNCTSYIEGENTVMSILEWPMLCRTNDDMGVAYEALKPYLDEEFAAKNVTLLDWWSTIGLGFYGVGETPQSLADFNKLKIRLYSVPITNVLLNYGVVPVSMTITDVVPALQRGVINAAITGSLYAYDMRWYDICDWAFMMNIAGASNGIWVNNDAIAELPEEVQQIVREEAHNYHDVNIAYNETDTQAAIDGMAENGCDVVYCSDEDYEQAAIYAIDIWEDMANQSGGNFKSALEDVREALGL